ncbi:hypothetical protein SAMN02927914_05681 [Mesorhizobium qingshengii]|uniref:Uncharacterized protein n=1 Tax=Mesorhizobium qingshengii TaxID=1165689 RepID=A0A1G5ZPT6_9HYPH|nr:hypothetical protein SAMN02927914_05681 [Mesorhizobium qingshengii]
MATIAGRIASRGAKHAPLLISAPFAAACTAAEVQKREPPPSHAQRLRAWCGLEPGLEADQRCGYASHPGSSGAAMLAGNVTARHGNVVESDARKPVGLISRNPALRPAGSASRTIEGGRAAGAEARARVENVRCQIAVSQARMSSIERIRPDGSPARDEVPALQEVFGVDGADDDGSTADASAPAQPRKAFLDQRRAKPAASVVAVDQSCPIGRQRAGRASDPCGSRAGRHSAYHSRSNASSRRPGSRGERQARA